MSVWWWIGCVLLVAVIVRGAWRQWRGLDRPFVCPRGHRHYEASAFCSVCGAGPVLERRS